MIANRLVLAFYVASSAGWNPRVDRTLPLVQEEDGSIGIDPHQVHQAQVWQPEEQLNFSAICSGLSKGYGTKTNKPLVHWVAECLQAAGIAYSQGFFENTHIPQLLFCNAQWHELLADYCRKKFLEAVVETTTRSANLS